MSNHLDEVTKLKLAKLARLEHEIAEKAKFPHLHMHRWYPWSKEFFGDWDTKKQILTAANQLGKSSSMIKKLIHFCITPELWQYAFPELMATGQKPSQIWYLYPTKDVATVEFNEKWKMFLPNVSEDDPAYGYKVKKGSYATVHSIHFNTGITIYFKTYKTDVMALQSGTASIVACDEELPVDLLPELQMRVNATNGFLFFVFTATMGQKFWKDVVENRTEWKDARVWQVSLFDSQTYDDGTPSMWTTDRIKTAIKNCISDAEVQRRIYGRFVLDSGLLFPQFDLERHVKLYHPVPKEWMIFAGIDYGTGGKKHPAAIAVIAVDPKFQKARLIRFWRGDKIETTAQDIVDKYMEITVGLNVTTAYYDYGPGGRDMGTIAQRLGLPFQPADKGVETGRGVVQSLLKNDALILYESNEPAMQEILQTRRLVEEFLSATDAKDKRSMKNDDGLDALRYSLSKIGFDWDSMALKPYDGESEKKKVHVYTVDEFRRGEVPPDDRDAFLGDMEEEFGFWQEHLEM